jgi:hypothetical protein
VDPVRFTEALDGISGDLEEAIAAIDAAQRSVDGERSARLAGLRTVLAAEAATAAKRRDEAADPAHPDEDAMNA